MALASPHSSGAGAGLCLPRGRAPFPSLDKDAIGSPDPVPSGCVCPEGCLPPIPRALRGVRGALRVYFSPHLAGNRPEQGPCLLSFLFPAARLGPCTQLVLNKYLRKGGEKEGRERRREREVEERGCVSMSSLCASIGPENQGGSSGVSALAVDYWGFILLLNVPSLISQPRIPRSVAGQGGIPLARDTSESCSDCTGTQLPPWSGFTTNVQAAAKPFVTLLPPGPLEMAIPPLLPNS